MSAQDSRALAKSWLAASWMECMAKVSDPDQDKMHACNGENTISVSVIKLIKDRRTCAILFLARCFVQSVCLSDLGQGLAGSAMMIHTQHTPPQCFQFVWTEHPPTPYFLMHFTHVFTPHCGLRCRTTCLRKRALIHMSSCV